jgi:hypothetical protein
MLYCTVLGLGRRQLNGKAVQAHCLLRYWIDCLHGLFLMIHWRKLISDRPGRLELSRDDAPLRVASLWLTARLMKGLPSHARFPFHVSTGEAAVCALSSALLERNETFSKKKIQMLDAALQSRALAHDVRVRRAAPGPLRWDRIYGMVTSYS